MKLPWEDPQVHCPSVAFWYINLSPQPGVCFQPNTVCVVCDQAVMGLLPVGSFWSTWRYLETEMNEKICSSTSGEKMA
jgi:hypothetical protein